MTTTTEPRYLTTREAALELHVSQRTIRRAVANGALPGVRLGDRGRIRVPVAALEELLRPVRIRTEETDHEHLS